MIGHQGLLLIDPQEEFVERSDETRIVGQKICELLDQPVFPSTAVTRFRNREGSPHHEILGWHKMTNPEECELWGPILERVNGSDIRIIDKNGYSSATPEVLRSLKPGQTVFLAGLDTDCCILATAIDLFEKGIRPVVLADFCGSSGGVEAHSAGLQALNRMIGRHNVVCEGGTAEELKQRLQRTGLLSAPDTEQKQDRFDPVGMDLNQILHDCFTQLSSASIEARHPLRKFTLATMDAHGNPKQRTVLLRGFDSAGATVQIFTDKRSHKVSEIEANPAVALCFYDESSHVQILLTGFAQCFYGDERASSAWEQVTTAEYAHYLGENAPGAVQTKPSLGRMQDISLRIPLKEFVHSAFDNFAVIDVHFHTIEWVLAQGTNCLRARFQSSLGAWQASWLTP